MRKLIVLPMLILASTIWAVEPMPSSTPINVDCSPFRLAQLREEINIDQTIYMELIREANALSQAYAGRRMPDHVLDRWIQITTQALNLARTIDQLRQQIAMCP